MISSGIRCVFHDFRRISHGSPRISKDRSGCPGDFRRISYAGPIHVSSLDCCWVCYQACDHKFNRLLGTRAKVADPSLPNGLEERGSGDLHRLNAQGGSQGLPPWWSPLTTRGAREGTCNLGLRFNALFRLKGVYEGAPALLNPFDLRT